ncbi:HU family DNA-binding protein [Eleftheria terrae]|uniref:HU family DNA-binding protein n=1 Tax=Eleftheria terrae TaxID=1597781 RepID=UPI00263A70E6|nr:HU family DNA-binding protein [Eleftheria terrae]WKB53566.1 HU family DNA-binding protein [Eleftheria terrae]
MNRVELIEKIASEHELTKAAAGRILDTLVDSIVTAVKKGDTVQLIGFGTFKRADRAARTGFNPQAGKAIKIPATKVPKFVPGAKFKAAVDPKAAKRKAAAK